MLLHALWNYAHVKGLMASCVSRYFTDFRKNCAQNQKSRTGNFRFFVRSIFAHAQISITTETLQPPWLTETQGDGWVSGTLGRDMAANPLQALIMHSLRMFISVHKGACADFGLTLQTTNLKFPVAASLDVMKTYKCYAHAQSSSCTFFFIGCVPCDHRYQSWLFLTFRGLL